MAEGIFESKRQRTDRLDWIREQEKALRRQIDAEVPLEAAFSLAGADNTPHIRGGFTFYKSNRSESGDRTASLEVTESKRAWHDWSGSGSTRDCSGVGVVSLALYLNPSLKVHEVIGALRHYLSNPYVFNTDVVYDKVEETGHRAATAPGFTVAPEVKDADNIAYFESRGIPAALLKRYCKACILKFKDTDGSWKPFETVAFPMQSGGYALRAASGFKRNLKGFPADISLIGPDGGMHTLQEGAGSRRLLVFEGFSDFLSYCIWRNERNVKEGKPVDFNPPCDCIVLNSTSNLSKIFPVTGRYDDIRVFNDNDDGGRSMVAELALHRCEERGVPFVPDAVELEFIRNKALAYVERAEKAERDRICEEKGGDLSLTKDERKRIADAGKAAVGHFNLGSRTSELDGLALRAFLDRLTPDNFATLCSRHNLSPYRNTVLLHRLSAAVKDGLVVNGDFSKRLGVSSVAQAYYPDDNDLNDRWRKRWKDRGVKEAWKAYGNGRITNNKNSSEMENNINSTAAQGEIRFEPVRGVTDRHVREFRERMKPEVWKQMQDELIGARDEHRLPQERKNPDLWYRRNMDIFIDECRKHYGPSPLMAMISGGYTAVPVRCEGRHMDGFYLVNFDLRDARQPDWRVYPVNVNFEKKKVNDAEGNFLYYEKEPVSYVRDEPKEPLLYGKGRNGNFFSDDIYKELRATGYYHLPVDPGTLEPFSDHTDRQGNVYAVNENGDLTRGGEVVCKDSDAVIVALNGYDPNLVMGISVNVVEQYLERNNVFEAEGEMYKFSKEERMVLSRGGNVNVRLGDRDITVHYDARACQPIAGEPYDSILIKENIEKNNELLKSKTLGTGEGEYPKKGI